MHKIVITILPDGTVQHDFQGFVGQACMQAEDELRAKLAELGIQVQTTRFEPKPELAHSQEAYRPQQGSQQQEA
jgi:DUF2997 family protein